MNITMNNVHIRSIEDITKLMQAPHTLALTNPTREERYGAIVETLVGVRYKTLRKKDAGIVQGFLVTVAGYSDRQVKRLVREWKSETGLRYVKRKSVGAARRTYGPEDIALLIQTDILHKTQN